MWHTNDRVGTLFGLLESNTVINCLAMIISISIWKSEFGHQPDPNN